MFKNLHVLCVWMVGGGGERRGERGRVKGREEQGRRGRGGEREEEREREEGGIEMVKSKGKREGRERDGVEFRTDVLCSIQ